MPPGVPVLPAFAAAKAAEVDGRDQSSEDDDTGVPPLAPL